MICLYAMKIKLISYYIDLIFNTFNFPLCLETKWSKIQGFIKNWLKSSLPPLNKKSTALGGMLFVLNVPPFKIFLAIFYKAGLYFRGLAINLYQKYMVNNLPGIYPLNTAWNLISLMNSIIFRKISGSVSAHLLYSLNASWVKEISLIYLWRRYKP